MVLTFETCFISDNDEFININLKSMVNDDHFSLRFLVWLQHLGPVCVTIMIKYKFELFKLIKFKDEIDWNCRIKLIIKVYMFLLK